MMEDSDRGAVAMEIEDQVQEAPPALFPAPAGVDSSWADALVLACASDDGERGVG
jgi:hypothetical protein